MQAGRRHGHHEQSVFPPARSDWIRWAVEQAGGDSARFSGISASKRGISVAIKARIHDKILYLQSGHDQALPAHSYML